MKHLHPTRNDLIDLHFELLDEPRAEEIRDHLATCAECRRTLEDAASRLDQLDLLRETPEVPQSLLNDLEELMAAGDSTDVSSASPAPVSSGFRALPLILAAAAIVVALALVHVLIKPPSMTPGDGGEPIVTANGAAEEAPAFKPGSNIELNVLPTRDDVELTIYNEADLTLVRERRKVTVRKGWNWLQFMWTNTLIDPTSLDLVSKTPGLNIEVSEMTYPPRTKGIGRWLLYADSTAAADIEITYLTSGIAWRAFYMGTLSDDETHMRLQGYVRIDNHSGDDYDKARARVVVGKVGLAEPIAALAARTHPHGSPVPCPAPKTTLGIGNTTAFDFDGDANFTDTNGAVFTVGGGLLAVPKEVLKQRLSEYVLYTIEGRETIPNGWGKRLPSFDPAETPVENLYKYDEERWACRVTRFLSFTNDEDHKLGETPLPNGTIRVFGVARKTPPVADPAGDYLTYVGQAPVKYIPVGEEVELELGEAREVLVEPILLSQRTENFEHDRHGNVSGWDDVLGWSINIRNARHVPVKVEITRAFPTAYWTQTMHDHADTFEKHDATHARFVIDIPPRQDRTITFDIRLHQGTREDDWQEPVNSQNKRNSP